MVPKLLRQLYRSELALLGAVVASGTILGGCAADPATTHLFVRDPHQVWVEAASANGEEVVLPPGEGLRGVQIREADEGTQAIVSYATLIREPSGGITVDDHLCAPWATSPLNGSGELHVLKGVGDAPFTSDGQTVRVALVCKGPHHATIQMDFVTPWSNVREVRVVTGEYREVAAPSTHPGLQRQDWLQ